MPNVSEGRDAVTIAACGDAVTAAGATLAHATSDAVHDRSVFTYFGDADTVVRAAAALARVAAERIDLRCKRGAHPRIGALDVVPVIPIAGGATLDDAAAVAHRCAAAIWQTARVPSLFYGAASERARTLPDVRRGEFEGLAARAAAGERANVGETFFHLTAGTVAVGARPVLVAYNLVLASGDLALAHTIARQIRESGGGLRTLRAIGIRIDERRVQVSCNLTNVEATPLALVTALVRRLAAARGVEVAGSELVGLVPRAALDAVAALAFAPSDRY